LHQVGTSSLLTNIKKITNRKDKGTGKDAWTGCCTNGAGTDQGSPTTDYNIFTHGALRMPFVKVPPQETTSLSRE